jgi:hypothetical protein
MIELALLVPILVLSFLLWDAKREARTERAELLLRIQAPEVVISQQAMSDQPPLAPMTPDLGPWEQPPVKEDK